ncbi:CPBP family intramembrane metalloprotease [Flavitalea sp. BT771]|uniref:CPBP family intramembrane glutamic endopeptidase n=1 Tax=Flavitalea sp. BT771 TaxID=3063329 RepID=UPI0026E183C8|nr:CPBP family intramembrane glutamic endopeptidase [Flavitalea sp. BT771]MDO6434284.1 CPBP family intramembrane metalloprotease [Flavitalea sp. BT771]MDV6223184.1 CPBP family intramembrane glutamic endopeptidase [Flavitalea sp. BT771]
MPNGQRIDEALLFMDRRLKIPSAWSQLALFLLLLGGSILFTSVFVSLLAPGNRSVNGEKLLQMISTMGIFGLPAYFYAVMTSREPPLDFLGLRKTPHPAFYALAVVLLLFSFPFEGWLGQINKNLPLSNWMINMEKEAEVKTAILLKTHSAIDIVINVIVIAAIPAIFEEACFRGALQRILIQIFKSPWVGITACAIFFSAMHFQFRGFLPRMFLGTLLGAIYWYSGSLWASILAHFFTNGIQVVAVSFYPRLLTEDPSVPLYWAIISLVIVVGLLSVLRRRSTANYAEVYAEGTNDYDGFPE